VHPLEVFLGHFCVSGNAVPIHCALLVAKQERHDFPRDRLRPFRIVKGIRCCVLDQLIAFLDYAHSPHEPSQAARKNRRHHEQRPQGLGEPAALRGGDHGDMPPIMHNSAAQAKNPATPRKHRLRASKPLSVRSLGLKRILKGFPNIPSGNSGKSGLRYFTAKHMFTTAVSQQTKAAISTDAPRNFIPTL
jgi:hypothetical protein